MLDHAAGNFDAIEDELQQMLALAQRQFELMEAAAFGDEASLEQLQQIIKERSACEERIDNLRGDTALPERFRPQLEALQTRDAANQERLLAAMGGLRRDLKKLHTGRQGRKAYGGFGHTSEGAFIDRKK